MNYIALEGIDGAGKSTQIEALKAIYKDAVFTAEPCSELIRELVQKSKMHKRAKLFLFLADRADHIESLIRPNLNHLIISDRSVVSGIAYALDSTNGEFLKTLNLYATDGILPTKVVLLQMSRDLLIKRLDRELDEIEKAGFDYLLQVQTNMIEACKLLAIPLVIIDASLPADQITSKIKDFIDDNRA